MTITSVKQLKQESVRYFASDKAPAIDRAIVAAFMRRVSYWMSIGSFVRNKDFDLVKGEKIYDRFYHVINRYVTK